MVEARSRGQLLRLARELAQERAVLDAIAARIARDAQRLAISAVPDEARGIGALVALDLHRWYSALESIIERAERAFGTLPSGPEWHTDLLEGAALEIPSLRPPIVPVGALDVLRDVMKFRHFLRHAYAVELDAGKLRTLAAKLGSAHAPVSDALVAFEAFLSAAADALDG